MCALCTQNFVHSLLTLDDTTTALIGYHDSASFASYQEINASMSGVAASGAAHNKHQKAIFCNFIDFN